MVHSLSIQNKLHLPHSVVSHISIHINMHYKPSTTNTTAFQTLLCTTIYERLLYHNSHEWYNDQFMYTSSFSITIHRLTFLMGERIAREKKNSLSVNICTHST